MARFGLCSGTYNSQSPSADAERAVNWYPEQVESQGKSQVVLYPCHGTKVFCTLDSPIRGELTVNGRTFKVGGASFYEVRQDGSFTKYGTVASDGKLAYMAANQANQVAISSGGSLYIFDTALNALSSAQVLVSNCKRVDFSNGYFIALLDNGEFQISALEDGMNWPGLQVVKPSKIPDQIIAAIVDHNQLWVFSPTKSMGYYDSGSSSIFDPIGDSAFCESGTNSPDSIIVADNTFFWIDSSLRGGGVARRLNGSTPQRISNHAIEYQWSLYPKISDAIGYSFEDQGHTFLRWYFPSANGGSGATWAFDIATGLWHEPLSWNTTTGNWEAHRSQCHTFNWGKHLVGDWKSGNVYELSLSNYDDAGSVLRRMRISPPIANENEWIYHQRLQVDLEAGLALQSGQGKTPAATLSWSDDGGHTWSNEYTGSAGLVGQYKGRAIWRRLGRSRQRYYKVVVSDPVPWRIIEGDLIATPGWGPTERISKQYQKAI